MVVLRIIAVLSFQTAGVGWCWVKKDEGGAIASRREDVGDYRESLHCRQDLATTFDQQSLICGARRGRTLIAVSQSGVPPIGKAAERTSLVKAFLRFPWRS